MRRAVELVRASLFGVTELNKNQLAISETVDDAGDDAEIVLDLHRRGRVGKRGTQIISADADGQRPGEGAFDSATKRIGESSHGSTQVIGSLERNRAVHQTDAGQSVNEDPGISMLRGIKHGTGQKAQNIAAMSGAEHVANAGIAGIDRHSPTRVEVHKAVGVHSAKADALSC
jgi:hypothetical protein